MSKSKKDRLNFVQTPTYLGGSTAMKKFIAEQLTYPKEAIQNKIEGTVSLKYDIDYKGKVIKTQVVSGIGYGCDEEAARIVKLLKFELKSNHKVKVVFHKSIKIRFKLPKQEKISISYNFTSEKSKQNSSGYSYTIKF